MKKISVLVIFILVGVLSAVGVSAAGFQKINDSSIPGELDNFDFFGGSSVASIGDVDNDGVDDIVVGARFDDDGGVGPFINRGAVYVLFMKTDGTIKGFQKISDTQGSFAGILDDLDDFALSVAGIGDLDGDSVEDIVVGAPADDDGGSNIR